MNANDYRELDSKLTEARENEPEYGDNAVDWALREPLAQWHDMVEAADTTKVDDATLRTLAVMLHAWWEDFAKPLAALALHPEVSADDMREYYAYTYDDPDGWLNDLFTESREHQTMNKATRRAVNDTLDRIVHAVEADLNDNHDMMVEYTRSVKPLADMLAGFANAEQAA